MPSLPTNLEQWTRFVPFDGSEAVFPGVNDNQHDYLRTGVDDYNTNGFTAEMTEIVRGSCGPEIAFFGMEQGDGDLTVPLPVVLFRT